MSNIWLATPNSIEALNGFSSGEPSTIPITLISKATLEAKQIEQLDISCLNQLDTMNAEQPMLLTI